MTRALIRSWHGLLCRWLFMTPTLHDRLHETLLGSGNVSEITLDRIDNQPPLRLFADHDESPQLLFDFARQANAQLRVILDFLSAPSGRGSADGRSFRSALCCHDPPSRAPRP